MKVDENEISFAPCNAGDFEQMLAMRLESMRASLERLGRYNPERSRERLERSFYPHLSEFILWNGERIGFYTFRPGPDGFHLEHFYLLPPHQSQGIGSRVLSRLTALADATMMPIFLGALKESAANRFYQRHGFEMNADSEWDNYYIRKPQAGVSQEI